MLPGKFTKTDEMEYRPRTKKEIEEEAESINCKVIYPRKTEIFLDIDSEESYKTFLTNFPWVQKHIADYYGAPCKIKKDYFSKSGFPKRHVIIDLGLRFSSIKKVAFALLLGSDPNREMAHMDEYKIGAEVVSCFMEPKDE